MKQCLDRFQKTPDVGDEGNDRNLEDSIEREFQEARNALPKRKDEEEDLAEDEENDSGSDQEDELVSQHAPGGASDRIQEMPMEIEEDIIGEDMPADHGQIDLTAVEPAEIKVPANIVGTVIDMIVPPSDARLVMGGTHTRSPSYDDNNNLSRLSPSSGTIAPPLPIIPQDCHSLPPLSTQVDLRRSKTLPTAIAEHGQSIEEQPATTVQETILEGRERTPTLAVNLISATPQTSQDAPAQTITNLIVPKNVPNAPKPRSRS